VNEPRAYRLDGDYSAVPTDQPWLSQSIAHVLLEQSAAHAHALHPRLGNVRRKASDEMEEGTLLHRLLLGVGDDIVIVPFPTYHKKDAQNLRDEARAASKVPVLERRFADAQSKAEKIRSSFERAGVVLDGESEVPIAWREDLDRGSIWCRGKLDHLSGTTITDLKKTVSAHPRACAKHVIDYGMAMQRAAYVRGAEALFPQLVGRFSYVIAFFETDPPYEVYPCELDGTFRTYGERQWERACATWERCVRRGEWPGYASSEPALLEPPPWLAARMQEEL
jgi:hypothetical protein